MRQDDLAENEGNGLRLIFRALHYRNYRLFFAGQGVSLIGTWMQGVALSWLVYDLTKSTFLLGLVGFTGQIATFVLAPFAGVVVDRLHKRRILLMTQVLAMIQASVLTYLVWTHAITIWQILLLSAFLGLVNGFDTPARQAFVVEMVEKREDLGNAIALNSSMFNSARLIGPTVSGVIIATMGAARCFLFNAISYLAAIVALWAMRIGPHRGLAQEMHVVRELREGFKYTFTFRATRDIILMLALISFVGMPYSVLMPVFATKILHGGPATLGFLTASAGVGAMIGALFLASRRSVLGLGRWIPLAAGIMGASLIAFAFSHVLWLSLILLVGVGFASITQMASSNTILQTIVDDSKRGRVMSFYTMAFVGMMPFGSLAAGSLASRIGAPMTVALGGALALAGAGVFAWKLPELRSAVHPIYREKGIIPEVAKGVQAACEMTVPPEES